MKTEKVMRIRCSELNKNPDQIGKHYAIDLHMPMLLELVPKLLQKLGKCACGKEMEWNKSEYQSGTIPWTDEKFKSEIRRLIGKFSNPTTEDIENACDRAVQNFLNFYKDDSVLNRLQRDADPEYLAFVLGIFNQYLGSEESICLDQTVRFIDLLKRMHPEENDLEIANRMGKHLEKRLKSSVRELDQEPK